MNYIIMGMLFALGWHLVKLLYRVIEELLFTRLHTTKWYNIAAGKRPRETKNTMDVKSVKNKIGF